MLVWVFNLQPPGQGPLGVWSHIYACISIGGAATPCYENGL